MQSCKLLISPYVDKNMVESIYQVCPKSWFQSPGSWTNLQMCTRDKLYITGFSSRVIFWICTATAAIAFAWFERRFSQMLGRTGSWHGSCKWQPQWRNCWRNIKSWSRLTQQSLIICHNYCSTLTSEHLPPNGCRGSLKRQQWDFTICHLYVSYAGCKECVWWNRKERVQYGIMHLMTQCLV